MGKEADFQPRWLVSLMCQWARHELAAEDGALGYPKKAAFLVIHEARSSQTDPTGYSAKDFRELADALEDLRVTHLARWAAMMMYYKPWCIAAFRAEGYPFAPNQVYFDNLREAHSCMASKILSMKREMD